jgi:hypothetical protein
MCFVAGGVGWVEDSLVPHVSRVLAVMLVVQLLITYDPGIQTTSTLFM